MNGLTLEYVWAWQVWALPGCGGLSRAFSVAPRQPENQKASAGVAQRYLRVQPLPLHRKESQAPRIRDSRICRVAKLRPEPGPVLFSHHATYFKEFNLKDIPYWVLACRKVRNNWAGFPWRAEGQTETFFVVTLLFKIIYPLACKVEGVLSAQGPLAGPRVTCSPPVLLQACSACWTSLPKPSSTRWLQ